MPPHPDSRVRVLWLTKGLGPGGAERLLVTHAALGDREAFAYEAAYLLPWKDHLVPELEAQGVAVHCLEVRRETDLRWLRRLRQLLQGGAFDVVHTHSPYPAALARLALRSLPRRQRPAHVYTEHNRWPSHSPITRLANRLTYGLDDSHLAVSAEVRSSITRRWSSAVEVVTHGIDLDTVRRQRDDRAAVRAELGVAESDVLIGTVANLRATKGYPDLLQAARLVIEAVTSVRFVAVGQGPLAGELEQRRDALGLSDRFAFTGYRADAVRVMSAFDIFVLASHHEGRPVALMEAMALGSPVVTTSVGGVPEVVADGRAGILVPPAAPTALADALVGLARDPPRRRALGDAATAHADAFGARAGVAQVDAVYRRVATVRAP